MRSISKKQASNTLFFAVKPILISPYYYLRVGMVVFKYFGNSYLKVVTKPNILTTLQELKQHMALMRIADR